MFGVDDWIAALGGNHALALVAAVLLGLRHATDADHLTAVSSLVLSNQRDGASRAARLGWAWGLGHATTLVGFGLPVLLLAKHIPGPLLRGAEVAIGVIIIALALRLVVRWARGHYHSHPHTHDGVLHAHPHVHETAHGHDVAKHQHPHADGVGRSPLAAFAIGMVHGVGGSAGVGILVLSAAPNSMTRVASLGLFAFGTAISMALVSAAFGYALTREPLARRVSALVPVLAMASLVFGTWYTLAAVQ